ncbi:MAG: sugar kinase [Candidatus Omnitrophica bacterium CG_4_10_14_0_2_um_filter_44_9]|nr:MAG: sugar kinase [Candidatus Omnitrophica bacterium CG_4_10_14_0_8_um_filter_44_12]PIZ84574.1 MAG: sugar kinase [Candidatus Omnitrophica bacterium CG_4_10_14_0_2_um_filter_44_9]
MSLLVLGTVALDTVKTPFGERHEMLGGSAAHFSMSASFFTKIDLVAIVGRDFPRKYIEFLSKKNIILTSFVIEPGRTFRWKGEYTGDLNLALTLGTELGVLSIFKPNVAEHQRVIKNIFLANVDPDLQISLLSKMRSPRLVGLDSMNYWIDHKKRSLLKLIKRVDIYVANDAEARSLSGESHLLKAAKCLRRMGAPIIIIKKGEHGVLVYSDHLILSLPAYPVEKVVDPTGAGDTFAGGFMGYLTKVKKINGNALKKAVTYGIVMASFNVEGFGVERSSKATLKDVEARLKRFRQIACF